jgi:ABC-type polysaccharide/polyol phosphate transport system ATPase subunit
MRGVSCRGVWKQYRMRGVRMLRDLFTRSGRADPGEPRGAGRVLWALQDVSLDVGAGEALGVIGNNGAGKSTLLKIISGVVWPTRGEVRVAGRVGALVDVGAGMHPELTGFENIFLYGAILGMSRREIRARFDSIVEFSELATFLDVPVKRYSSGMKIRLGFSVAAHLDPDVLLVDEVLAVGDVAFQRKCLERIRALREAGTAILLVSHDLATVERVCARAVLVEGGRIVDAGRSQEVVRRYREAVEREFVARVQGRVLGSEAFAVDRVVLTDAQGVQRSGFRPGERVTVHWHCRTDGGPFPLEFVVKVVDSDHTTLFAARSDGRLRAGGGQRQGVVQCAFRVPPLAPRTYQVWGHVVRATDGREVMAWQPLAALVVAREDAMEAEAWPWQDDAPLLDVPVRWSFDGLAERRTRRITAGTLEVADAGDHAAPAGGAPPAGSATGDGPVAAGPSVAPGAPTPAGARTAGRGRWAWRALMVCSVMLGVALGVVLGVVR